MGLLSKLSLFLSNREGSEGKLRPVASFGGYRDAPWNPGLRLPVKSIFKASSNDQQVLLVNVSKNIFIVIPPLASSWQFSKALDT